MSDVEWGRDRDLSFRLSGSARAALLTVALLVAACGRSGESHSTDLIRATESGSSDEVSRLLAGGADPNGRSSLGFTALFAAVRIGAVDKVKLLVDAGADVQATLPPSDLTPLMFLAQARSVSSETADLAVIKELLVAGADSCAKASTGQWEGLTASAIAQRSGRSKVADALARAEERCR